MIARSINEDLATVKEMIKEAYDPDLKKFKENLPGKMTEMYDVAREDGIIEAIEPLPDEVRQRIIDLVEQGKKIPRRFVESKPWRVVDLYNEVEYIMAPNSEIEKVENLVK